MPENKKKPEKEKHRIIDCHESLLKILDKIREDVKYKTWEVVTPSYYEATEILAKKIDGAITI